MCGMAIPQTEPADRSAVLAQLEERSATWHQAARHGIRAGRPDALAEPGDHVRGGDAGLEVVEYGHYLCEDCVDVRSDLASAGPVLGERVRFGFRHFVLTTPTIEPALRAAEAAEAAAAQGRFWEMHVRLLEPAARFGDHALREHARAIGLDLARYDDDLASGVHLARIVADVESGLAAGVDGTPTFFLGGVRVEGGYEEDELTAALGRALGEPGLAAELRAAHAAALEPR